MKKSAKCLTVIVKGKTTRKFLVRKGILVNFFAPFVYSYDIKEYSFFINQFSFINLLNFFCLKENSFLNNQFLKIKKVYFKIVLVYSFFVSLLTKMNNQFSKIMSVFLFFKNQVSLWLGYSVFNTASSFAKQFLYFKDIVIASSQKEWYNDRNRFPTKNV